MIAYPFHLILVARRLVLAALIVTLAGITGARAELRLDITRGRVEPMPIAITPMARTWLPSESSHHAGNA